MYLLIIEKPAIHIPNILDSNINFDNNENNVNSNNCNNKEGKFKKNHWKLDFHEGPARMHMRLKRNYNFDSHISSLVYDKTKQINNDVDNFEEAATNILRRLGELKSINVRKQRGESMTTSMNKSTSSPSVNRSFENIKKGSDNEKVFFNFFSLRFYF
jgi:hypothetical protein